LALVKNDSEDDNLSLDLGRELRLETLPYMRCFTAHQRRVFFYCMLHY